MDYSRVEVSPKIAHGKRIGHDKVSIFNVSTVVYTFNGLKKLIVSLYSAFRDNIM